MAHGGKRAGAGGKKGSIRPNFNMHWSQEDIAAYMQWVKENYQNDIRLATWVGDHLFGKAPQPISGDEDNPLTVKVEGLERVLSKVYGENA